MSMGIILTRRHKFISARAEQLELNELAYRGGQPYIDKRLCRATNESELSWSGVDPLRTNVPTGLQGRKQRTALINDAGRVVQKIEQYLFKKPVERGGVDEVWAKNVDGQDQTLLQFWREANNQFTVAGWCWVQVSRFVRGFDPEQVYTLADKREGGDLPRWTLWPALSVPDWSFGPDGKLNWILVEEWRYLNEDPFKAAGEEIVRTLWMREGGGVTIRRFRKRATGLASGGAAAPADDGGRSEAEAVQEAVPEIVPDLTEIPFVCIGRPSADPWWFDDVENLQAWILNKDSLHGENINQAVFPQLVIPQSMYDNARDRVEETLGYQGGDRTLQVTKEITRSPNSALVEAGEDRSTTRYLTLDPTSFTVIPAAVKEKRMALFDMVGLSLFNKETRTTQTAESKEFDQLDTSSTLQARALLMQESEKRLVELSREMDGEFAEYDPVWPNTFDVVDKAADMQVISMVSQLPGATLSMKKLALLAGVRVIQAVGGYDEELIESAGEEIRALEEADIAPPVPGDEDEDEADEDDSSASSASSAG